MLVSIVFFQSTLFLSNFAYVKAEESSVVEEAYLIISAVQITGGTGHTQEDFIELYNPTNLPLDLNGYRLVKRTAAATTDTVIKAWSSSTIVQPYHFYLWSNSSFSSLPMSADVTSSATLADNNGIALRKGAKDSGEIIDDISWGETANGFNLISALNPSANESLSRTDLFSDEPQFSIAPSTPRNSQVELLPETEEEEEPPVEEDPPVDEDPESEDDPEDDRQEDSDEEVELKLKITEVYPNPSGSDSGFEQVELFNDGDETVSLEGLVLDDISSGDAVSSNAYILPELSIASHSYLTITIPSGKFSLNNTGGDVVSLLDSTNNFLDSVTYSESTPEAKSWTMFEGDWAWAPETLGKENGNQPPEELEEEKDDEEQEETPDYGEFDNSALQIYEIYSVPNKGEQEFIEIYNSGEEVAQLAVVSLWVGQKHKVLPEHKLASGEYYVITQSVLPVQLRNSGQTLKLIEGSKLIDEISYPALSVGNSYARFEDGFLQTTEVTKAKNNILKLLEVAKKEITAEAKKTVAKSTKKTSASVASKSAAKKPTNSNTNKPVEKTNQGDKNQIEEPTISSANTSGTKEPIGKIIAMGAAAVTAGIVALYKLVFSAGHE